MSMRISDLVTSLPVAFSVSFFLLRAPDIASHAKMHIFIQINAFSATRSVQSSTFVSRIIFLHSADIKGEDYSRLEHT